jgi:hypothetical protein
MDRPYYVEDDGKQKDKDSYALVSSADGVMATGTDLVFMHRLADLLNEDVNGKDVHR